MPDQKLKCGAQGCGYETPEVDISIAVVLLEYHRQDDHAQVGAGVGDGGDGGTQGARQATAGAYDKEHQARVLSESASLLRAYNKDHQARVLSESASLLTLQDKLDRLCTLEKYESSSATLSGNVQFSAGVKVVEVKKIDTSKCSSCHRTHKKCEKCQRIHPCMIECYNCHKKGHVRWCCPAHKIVEESRAVGEVKEMVAETEAFSMELVALEFMAGQEAARINKQHKRARQRARDATGPLGDDIVSQLGGTEAAKCQGEEEECSICQVGRGMERFVAEGMDHMEWDNGQGGFVKTSPREPPLLRVGVKVLSQVQKLSWR